MPGSPQAPCPGPTSSSAAMMEYPWRSATSRSTSYLQELRLATKPSLQLEDASTRAWVPCMAQLQSTPMPRPSHEPMHRVVKAATWAMQTLDGLAFGPQLCTCWRSASLTAVAWRERPPRRDASSSL